MDDVGGFFDWNEVYQVSGYVSSHFDLRAAKSGLSSLDILAAKAAPNILARPLQVPSMVIDGWHSQAPMADFNSC